MSNESTEPRKEANPIIDIIQKILEVGIEIGTIAEGSLSWDIAKDAVLDELKALIGIMEIASAENDYDKFKGWTDTVKGTVKTAVKILKKIELAESVIPLLDKVAPSIDIVAGWVKYEKSLDELFNEDQKWWYEDVSSGFDAASGILNTISGISKFVLPPLSPIAKLLSASYALAAQAFKVGDYFSGFAIAIVGTLASIAMGLAMKSLITIAVQALMSTITTALSSLSVSVAATVAPMLPLLPVVLPILALIASEIIAALASKPYAQGGFPATGRPFIAREAGPELVGRLNGRNAVVNNDQIVEAVSIGVYNACKSALYNRNSKAVATARVYLDGRQIAMAGQAS